MVYLADSLTGVNSDERNSDTIYKKRRLLWMWCMFSNMQQASNYYEGRPGRFQLSGNRPHKMC